MPSSWRESLADSDRTASIVVHSAPAPCVQRPPEPVAEAVLPGFAWSHNPIPIRNSDASAPVVDWSATGRKLPPGDDERQDAGGHWLTDFLGADTGHKADLAKLTGLKLKLDTGRIAKPH